MESLDYWRVCEQLSVVKAALLILETDPAHMPYDVEDWEPHHVPEGFYGVFEALQGAIRSGKLKAQILYDPRYRVAEIPPGAMAQFPDGGVQRLCRGVPDWYGTLIDVKDLREWLVQRGLPSPFFFPDGLPAADYLNSSDPDFSPKLYAAIAAWMAVKADPGLRRGKSVKSALSTWLNQHAAQYGLTKRDGTPNNTAIEEAAKVANWESTGGAPKTPE